MAKKTMIRGSARYGFSALLALVLVTVADVAHAQGLFGVTEQTNISTVSENIVNSSSMLPGLLTGVSYLLALLFGVTGILKLKEHVENPNQVAVRVPIIRFLIGGGLLALPAIYAAMGNAINGGVVTDFEAGTFSAKNEYSRILGIVSGVLGEVKGGDLNFILSAIAYSVRNVPALIAAVAYILGLLFGVIGLLKLKAHVENPDQVAMKESVIRLLIGGALFSLPTVYDAMQGTIVGGNYNDLDTVGGIMNLINTISGMLGDAAKCNPLGAVLGGGTSLGGAMCSISMHAGAFPAFLTAMAYLFGLILGLWGILKIQDHVLNPQQTNIWEGVSRFIAAGCFFALPAVLEIVKATVSPVTVGGTVTSVIDIVQNAGKVAMGFVNAAQAFACALPLGPFKPPCPAGPVGPSCNGLDGALQCFVSDISGPVTVVLNLFSMVGGTILIMIGISRLTKSAQEGARGPGGMGTIMTFVCGGLLLSYNEILGGFGNTIFGSNSPTSTPDLAYDTGMNAGEVAHANSVIMSVLQFMVIIGLISFVRGIFIIRGVAEGSSQASIMAGVTHMVGGALAVNLGPLLNAVQSTLGITGYGITFT